MCSEIPSDLYMLSSSRACWAGFQSSLVTESSAPGSEGTQQLQLTGSAAPSTSRPPVSGENVSATPVTASDSEKQMGKQVDGALTDPESDDEGKLELSNSFAVLRSEAVDLDDDFSRFQEVPASIVSPLTTPRKDTQGGHVRRLSAGNVHEAVVSWQEWKDFQSQLPPKLLMKQ